MRIVNNPLTLEFKRELWHYVEGPNRTDICPDTWIKFGYKELQNTVQQKHMKAGENRDDGEKICPCMRCGDVTSVYRHGGDIWNKHNIQNSIFQTSGDKRLVPTRLTFCFMA